MQTVARKQLISAVITVALLLSAASLGGIARDANAQSGTVAATRAVSVGQATKALCPDMTKTIITPTATQTSAAATSAETMAATAQTNPVTFASSRLTKQTQPGEFGILHTILDFDAGVTSAPYFFQGSVNLIVVEGQITYCSGALQRVLVPGDSWTIPPQVRFFLANAGSDMARISVVVIEPTPATATAAATGPATTPAAVTHTASPSATTGAAVPTQAATANAAAYLGVRAVGVDNTGARVTALLSNSPAAAAGVQVGDVITAVNGQSLASLVPAATVVPTLNPNEVAPIVTALLQVVARHHPGDVIQLTLQRNNQTITVNVKLGALPAGSQ